MNTKTTLKTFAVSLFALLFLSACAYAPGSHMDPSDAESTLGGEVRIHKIDPQLVSSMRMAAPSPQSNEVLERERAEYDYRVGRGDVLTITVWNHPELTTPAGTQRSAAEAGNWVHNDGTIFFPYIGTVSVEGMRVTEIRQILIDRLSDYIESPQVDVTIAAFRSKRIYVTGEVKTPGTLPLTNVPMTVLDAINQMGGITPIADWDNIILTRGNQEQRFSLRNLYLYGDTSQNALLRPGDIIHIERNDLNKVFVLGEVRTAGSVPVNRSKMTLAEALAEAGGIAEERADARGIFVFRAAPDHEPHLVDIYQLDVKEATSYVLADQFEMQPRDIVFVTAAPVARWNRVINQLMPTITGLYQVGRTERELSR